MDQLTDNEKQMLAREVAADDYHGYKREAFVAGWDAAMEYINARKVQQPPNTN